MLHRITQSRRTRAGHVRGNTQQPEKTLLIFRLRRIEIPIYLINEEKVQKYLDSLKRYHVETYEHSLRVGLLSVDLGCDNLVTDDELRLLGYSGLLHDIG